jgi:hypothetical protein
LDVCCCCFDGLQLHLSKTKWDECPNSKSSATHLTNEGRSKLQHLETNYTGSPEFQTSSTETSGSSISSSFVTGTPGALVLRFVAPLWEISSEETPGELEAEWTPTRTDLFPSSNLPSEGH